MGSWPKEADLVLGKGAGPEEPPPPPRRQAPLGPAWGFVTLTLWCWGSGPSAEGAHLSQDAPLPTLLLVPSALDREN